ncbi:Crp/Fnr family transcriptional regulator [Bradyrhizobium manausense]|uniref:Crp/Fnr family transcriptional regulator n=1 Tax=Bradyrhizobium manausense TaxID=989370 RepID=UPI001BA8F328|nr:Crp/Fnr family transcriptional regulator [Bradyrhizobium manausense]MBR0724147.1 Crp/Fnr family transcriptional regulator [Bradyrhizobium manausense]
MHPGQQLEFLKRVQILAGISQVSLEELAKTCRWHTYKRGEEILGYRDPSNNVFFLVSGRVRAIIHSARGKAIILRDLRTGDIFGEISAIDGSPRSASIEALEAATVATLTSSQFENLLLNEPSVAMATLRHIAGELRRLSQRVLEFSTLVVQNRIQAELLRLAAEADRDGAQPLLSPAPSLSDIANRVSTHREAVSREVSRLTSIGLLRREGRNLRVTDIGRLEKLVRDIKGE